MSWFELSTSGSIMTKLQRFVIAVSGWLAVIASPNTTANEQMSESFGSTCNVNASRWTLDPAQPSDVVTDSSNANELTSAMKLAEEELSTAIRILERFKTNPNSAELKAYLDVVSAAVADVDEVTFENAQRIATNLRAGRTQFAEDVKKLSEYLDIAQAVDPSRKWHPTPSRFVRWVEREPGPPLVLTGGPARSNEIDLASWPSPPRPPLPRGLGEGEQKRDCGLCASSD
jgi:hypothetical protein